MKKRVFGMVEPETMLRRGDRWYDDGEKTWTYTRYTKALTGSGIYRRLITAPKLNVPSERKGEG